MKTTIKSHVILLLTCLLLNSSNGFSQCAQLIPLPGPFRYEAQMPTGWFYYVTTQTPACPPFSVAGTSNLPGMAINIAAPNTPNYMLDILSNLYVGDGVNISDNSSNSVGYSIGGAGVGSKTMFLWHSGDITSVYCGIQAGFGTPNIASSGAFKNTALGNGADKGFNGTGGTENCAFGYLSLTSNGSGSKNLGIGTQSLQSNITGGANVAVGHAAMWLNNSGSDNVAVGHDALYSNTSSNYNVAVGERALFTDLSERNTATGYNAGQNVDGIYNTANGFASMSGITGASGVWNDASGANSLLNLSSGGYNVSMGANSLNNIGSGSYNSALGYNAGQTATSDNYNLFLGAYADETSTGLTNASAIGYNASVTASNTMILGDNSGYATWAGIGFNSSSPAPANSLEINARNAGGTPIPNWAGLRFTQLISTSPTVPNPGSGVLSVSATGDVIYVDETSSNAYIGTCGNPNVIASTGGVFALAPNNANFYFTGNGSSSFDEEDVLVGYPCTTTTIPAKLNVLQNSLFSPTSTSTTPSIGLYVENDDVRYWDGYLSLNHTPTIGIQSFVQGAYSGSGVGCKYTQIAGLFEVGPPLDGCLSPQQQYAILVPPHGGVVSIGYKPELTVFIGGTNPLLYVNGSIEGSAGIVPPILRTGIGQS